MVACAHFWLFVFVFPILPQIDWGNEIISITNAGSDNVDWGEAGEEDSAGIDWGGSDDTIDWGDGGQTNEDGDIDWGGDGADEKEVTLDIGEISLEGSGQGKSQVTQA